MPKQIVNYGEDVTLPETVEVLIDNIDNITHLPVVWEPAYDSAVEGMQVFEGTPVLEDFLDNKEDLKARASVYVRKELTSPDYFCMTVEPGYKEFSINMKEGPKDCTIFWGDGTSTEVIGNSDWLAKHTYADSWGDELYDITIEGTYPGFNFINDGINGSKRVISINQ